MRFSKAVISKRLDHDAGTRIGPILPIATSSLLGSPISISSGKCQILLASFLYHPRCRHLASSHLLGRLPCHIASSPGRRLSSSRAQTIASPLPSNGSAPRPPLLPLSSPPPPLSLPPCPTTPPPPSSLPTSRLSIPGCHLATFSSIEALDLTRKLKAQYKADLCLGRRPKVQARSGLGRHSASIPWLEPDPTYSISMSTSK